MRVCKSACVFFATIFSFCLFIFNSGNVFAQEASTATTKYVDSVANVRTDSAKVFIEQNCEPCEAVSILIASDDFKNNKVSVDVVDITNIDKGNLSDYANKCEFEDDVWVTPSVVYGDTCLSGLSKVSSFLFGLSNNEDNYYDVVKETASTLTTVIEDLESVSLIDKAVSSVFFIPLCVVLGLLLVVLIYFVVRYGKTLSKKGKVLTVLGFVAFLLIPSGYIFYVTNSSTVDLDVKDASARCYYSNATGTDVLSGCDSYEELVVERARIFEKQGTTGSWADEMKAAAAKITQADIDKANAETLAQLEQNNTMSKLVDVCKVTTGCTYDSTSGSFKTYGTAISSSDLIKQTDVNTLHDDSMDDTLNQLKNIITPADAETNKPANTTINVYACIDNVYDCNDSNKKVLTYRESGDDCPSGTTKCTDITDVPVEYKLDEISGEWIAVPTGKAIVDYCTGEGTGNNILATKLCDCGNGIWTTGFTGTCDQICRVEGCTDEECNENEDPPDNPPTSGPYCGDGILGNVSGETCEYSDPSGVSCSWNVCLKDSCTCPSIPEPYCGDGLVKEGEECEVGNPSGTSCTWDSCTHLTCECIKPGCGDGTLNEGEKCESGDPSGVSCLWDNECDKTDCSCTVTPSASCGDGTLDEGEKCESGDPEGSSCAWDKCSKSTCTCPVPQTAEGDSSTVKIIFGILFIAFGLSFGIFYRFFRTFYIKVGDGVLRIGREFSYEKKKEKWEGKTLKKISKR